MADQRGSRRWVFISYVQEDRRAVDRLQRILESAELEIWRDVKNLGPGDLWQDEIRRTITKHSLAFIACFSVHSSTRVLTYQREELLLAVEQARLRGPSEPWLIPVRLSDCELPAYNLGAGRTLDSLQRVDLFDDRWDEGCARLVARLIRIQLLDNDPNDDAQKVVVHSGETSGTLAETLAAERRYTAERRTPSRADASQDAAAPPRSRLGGLDRILHSRILVLVAIAVAALLLPSSRPTTSAMTMQDDPATTTATTSSPQTATTNQVASTSTSMPPRQTPGIAQLPPRSQTTTTTLRVCNGLDCFNLSG